MELQTIAAIRGGFDDGRIIPYLGAGVLALADESCAPPMSPQALVSRLTTKASVPHKIRNNLTATAQFIENFKHRKTVTSAMTEAFSVAVPPTTLHRYLAVPPPPPLVVHAWYDNLPQTALAGRPGWGMVQGVSQAEHFGHWVKYFRPDGSELDNAIGGTTGVPEEAETWTTLLYQPLGSVSPAANFLVSDSDFVEVLTEIDIQTPIPERVQNLRIGRNFLFLGCRFATQIERIFAHQIMKRSSARHWAVLPEAPTRNEARFLAQHNIEHITLTLPDFMAALTGVPPASVAPRIAATV